MAYTIEQKKANTARLVAKGISEGKVYKTSTVAPYLKPIVERETAKRATTTQSGSNQTSSGSIQKSEYQKAQATQAEYNDLQAQKAPIDNIKAQNEAQTTQSNNQTSSMYNKPTLNNFLKPQYQNVGLNPYVKDNTYRTYEAQGKSVVYDQTTPRQIENLQQQAQSAKGNKHTVQSVVTPAVSDVWAGSPILSLSKSFNRETNVPTTRTPQETAAAQRSAFDDQTFKINFNNMSSFGQDLLLSGGLQTQKNSKSLLAETTNTLGFNIRSSSNKTKQQAAQDVLKALPTIETRSSDNLSNFPFGVLENDYFVRYWAAGAKESRAQRTSGETALTTKDFIIKENNKLVDDFNKKWDSNQNSVVSKVSYNLSGTIKYDSEIEKQKDYKELQKKQKELGFYEDQSGQLKNSLVDTPIVPMYYKQLKETKDKYGDNSFEVRFQQTARVGGDLYEGVVVGYIMAATGLPQAIGAATTAAVGSTTATIGGLGLAGLGVVSAEESARRNYKALGMNGFEGGVEGTFSGAASMYGFIIGASEGKLSPIKFNQDISVADKEGNVNLKSKFSILDRPIITEYKGKLHLGYPDSSLFAPEDFPNDLSLGGMNFDSGIKGNFQKHYLNEKGYYTDNIVFQQSDALVKQVYGKRIAGNPEINLENSRTYSQLDPLSKEYAKGAFVDWGKQNTGKTLWEVRSFSDMQEVSGNVINAFTQTGLERFYGSAVGDAEGGFKGNFERNIKDLQKTEEFKALAPQDQDVVLRQIYKQYDLPYGDFDLAFRDQAIPKAQQFVDNAPVKDVFRVAPETSLVEVKTNKGWVHFLDLHGSDTPEELISGNPWGLPVQDSKTIYVSGQAAAGNQLSQEVVNQATRVNQLRLDNSGRFFVSPEEQNMKAVSGLISESNRINEFYNDPKLTKAISSTTNILKVTFPNVDITAQSNIDRMLISGGSTAAPSASTLTISKWAVNPRFEITPSEANKRNNAAFSAFLPEGAQTQSKGIDSGTFGAFMPISRVSPPSPSLSMGMSPYSVPSFKSSPITSVSPLTYISPSPKLKSYSSGKSSPYNSPSVSPSISNYPSPYSISPSKSPYSISPSPPPSPYSISPSHSPSLYSISTSPSFKPTPTPIPSFFGSGDLGGGGGLGRISIKPIKQPKGYNPDFVSAFFGIRGKPSNFATYSGIGLRPIPMRIKHAKVV